MAGDSRLLVNQRETGRSRTLAPDVHQAWRWVGWFGLVLALAGVGDWMLAWVPPRFGNPEWEFGTTVASISGLPLVAMGLAGILGSSVARGVRWQVISASAFVLVFAAIILAALVLFALDIPFALAAVSGPAKVGILKAIAKTLGLGVLFAVAFVVAGVGSLRRVSRSR